MLHKLLQLISYLFLSVHCIYIFCKNRNLYTALFGVFFFIEAIRLTFLEGYLGTTPGLIIEVIEGGFFLIALVLFCIDKYKKANAPEHSEAI